MDDHKDKIGNVAKIAHMLEEADYEVRLRPKVQAQRSGFAGVKPFLLAALRIFRINAFISLDPKP